MTEEDKSMPLVLSWFMLVCSVGIPFGILVYGKCPCAHDDELDYTNAEPEEDNADADGDGVLVDASAATPFSNPMHSDDSDDGNGPLSAPGIDIDTGRTSSSTKKTKHKPEKENEPTKRESASKRNTRNTKMENPMFDAAGSSESDEEESPTGSFASANAARKKQMQT